MSRYIDLEELERRINENIKPETLEEKALLEWCKDECIRQGYAMPTADVVEVVRCKDCKYWKAMDTGFSWHNMGRTDGQCAIYWEKHQAECSLTEGEHYCSYGERR